MIFFLFLLQTSTHNICVRAKIINMFTPVTPKFYYIKVECKGSTLHKHVMMMWVHDVESGVYKHNCQQHVEILSEI